MDILRRYDVGELTAAIRNTLILPESMDGEKIMAAVEAGAGSCSTKVSLGQSNTMVRWMDQRKHQALT